MANDVPQVLVAFGDAVRKRRADAGMSQEQLAELADLHRTYVGGIERGERNVGLLNVARVADALGVTLADLMTDVDRRRQPLRPRR